MTDSFACAAPPRGHAPRWAKATGWFACTAFSLLAHSHAHGQPPPPVGDPADASATVPALNYRSPLPVAPTTKAMGAGSWRDANDTAARIGGWRSYLREAQAPGPTPAPTPTQAPATLPPPTHKH